MTRRTLARLSATLAAIGCLTALAVTPATPVAAQWYGAEFGAATLTAMTVPQVTSLACADSGNDAVISWSAPAGPAIPGIQYRLSFYNSSNTLIATSDLQATLTYTATASSGLLALILSLLGAPANFRVDVVASVGGWTTPVASSTNIRYTPATVIPLALQRIRCN